MRRRKVKYICDRTSEVSFVIVFTDAIFNVRTVHTYECDLYFSTKLIFY